MTPLTRSVLHSTAHNMARIAAGQEYETLAEVCAKLARLIETEQSPPTPPR